MEEWGKENVPMHLCGDVS